MREKYRRLREQEAFDKAVRERAEKYRAALEEIKDHIEACGDGHGGVIMGIVEKALEDAG